eukprot:gene6763-4155_t
MTYALGGAAVSLACCHCPFLLQQRIAPALSGLRKEKGPPATVADAALTPATAVGATAASPAGDRAP